MAKYDFFIAYPSPDKSEAEDLYWELGDFQRTVFFDAARLQSGNRWDSVLKTSIEEATHLVVLISPHLQSAHYVQDEIARAVTLARASGGVRSIVPVLMPGASQADIPYGLAAVQAIDASRSGGMRRVAKELHARFPPAPEATPSSGRGYEHVSHKLRLDRTAQWSQISDAVLREESSLFLFHGEVRQNVGLFVSRLEYFFGQEVKQPRTVRRIPFNIDGATPRCGADWLGHLRAAFDCKGPLATELRSMANGSQLLAVLCDAPLPLDDLRPVHVEALKSFLEHELPALVNDLQMPGALSVLLAVDYDEGEPPLLAQIEDWGLAAEAIAPLRFRALPKATLPAWHEIRDYVSNLRPRPSADALIAMRARFEAIVAKPGLTFDQITRFIETQAMLGD